MTVTAFATGDALTQKIWAKDWIDSSMNYSYFRRNGFLSTNQQNAIIWERTDLKSQKGDTVYLGNIQELSNAGITGDNAMEGSEEEMPSYDDALIIDQVRNAVRLEGAMTIQRAATNLRKYVRNVLRNWMANKIDQDIFSALGSSPTRVFYGGTATSIDTISSSSLLDITIISKARVNAGKTTPMIKPAMVDGKEIYALVCAPEAAYDLKAASTFSNPLQYAVPRGAKNPLFTKSYWFWDGVAIHDHRHVALSSTWGSGGNVNGATNLFLGLGSGAIGFAKERIWKEKLFDYDNSPGACVGAIFGVTKMVFNSEDLGLQVIRTYRTSIAEST